MTDRVNLVDLATPYDILRETIDHRIRRVLEAGQYIMGPEVQELETRLSDFTETEHSITCSSGTEALLISLMALHVGRGDDVITTPFTFVATVEVICLLGATPIFVDIEPDTYNIDPTLIEGAITPRTKAIIPVSLYGQVPDMDQINRIATKHGIPVIEDAAQSFGAVYRGKRSCNLSTIACTSFFPTKPLGCYGDGGAIFTNDADLAKIMRELRTHGQEKRYVHTRVGVGGRMDTIQCAVVLAKFDHFSKELELRQRVAERYRTLLEPLKKKLRLPVVRSDRSCVFAQYTIGLDDRERVRSHLESTGIATAIHYPIPLHQQPAYAAACSYDDLTRSEIAAKTVLSLPMHPYLDERTQVRIAIEIEAALVHKA
jgi:UDP-2-acetamido-2-deoxy-ribo-hexuluronate aminotransferase